MQNEIEKIEAEIQNQSAVEALLRIAQLFPGKVTFSTSLGLEDQVITQMILSNNLPIDVFTIDTWRLFDETEKTLERTIARYKKPIKIYYPDKNAVEELVTKKGNFSFFASIANRQECCFIRKVEPLKRALAGYKIWITGIRAEQSSSRTKMDAVEWDENNQIIKFHPLLNWNLDETTAFIRQHNIPYNTLHNQGYVSIGCRPCTRAIKLGEDFRAGRWWWENEDKKECGLHNIKNENKK